MAGKAHDANAKGPDAREAKRARLEQELRANLLKRKEQGRARKPPDPLTNREDRQAPKE
jgi:hypothetical protein